MDIYASATLARVVDDLRDSPEVGTFLISSFFNEASISTEEAVYFDVLTGKPRLAPFVSPLVEGQIVQALGYTTNSVKPAYIKDKRVLEDGKAIRRRPGMTIGAAMDPMTIRAMTIADQTEDQIAMVNRRMEWMAASALLTGSITVSGEKYPTTVVNFGRDAALSVTLTTTARWNDSAPTPLENLETWAGLIRDKSGATPTDVIMAEDVWTSFRKNADVKELWRRRKTRPARRSISRRTRAGSAPPTKARSARFESGSTLTVMSTIPATQPSTSRPDTS
jgi:hypothetical protein